MFQHASALWPWLNAFAYCLSPLSMNHSTNHFLNNRRGSFAILELVALVAAKKKVRIFKRRHHMTRLDMTFVKKNYTAGSDKSQLWTRPLFPFPLFDDKIASFCLQFLYVWPKYLLCKLLLQIPISQKSF